MSNHQFTRRAALAFLAAGSTLAAQETPAPPQQDPWSAKNLIQPKDLASALAVIGGSKPLLLHVGFPVMYRAAHIPGSTYAGPGAKPSGLEDLKKAVQSVPHNREIVLYCGCCPWDHCPNVRPAFRQLADLGFTNLKVLVIPANLHADWVEKGYPIEKAQ